MRLARRIESMPPYIFAQATARITELERKGVDVINLGVGSPDLPPPKPIIDMLYESSLEPDAHGYAGYYGIPPFRQAVAKYYDRRFGVSLDANREVLLLIGSKEGIANINIAYVDPGDIVLVPDPGYPTYISGAHLASGEVFSVPLLAENNYRVDLDAIPTDVAKRAKLLWLNYPNNPTGAVADLDYLARCVAFAREHDILLCYDNPYCDVTFDGYVAPSILQIPGAREVAIEFNSLSKTYNMAGWRVGMAVGGAQIISALARVKTNMDSGIFRPMQLAAAYALTGDQQWLESRNGIYQRRRDLVLGLLPAASLSAETPKGGLYVWARVPEGVSSAAYGQRALDESGVWVTPGTAFGDHGEGYVRISVTTPDDRLREAMERLAKLGW